jgi:hypothetical protein
MRACTRTQSGACRLGPDPQRRAGTTTHPQSHTRALCAHTAAVPVQTWQAKADMPVGPALVGLGYGQQSVNVVRREEAATDPAPPSNDHVRLCACVRACVRGCMRMCACDCRAHENEACQSSRRVGQSSHAVTVRFLARREQHYQRLFLSRITAPTHGPEGQPRERTCFRQRFGGGRLPREGHSPETECAVSFNVRTPVKVRLALIPSTADALYGGSSTLAANRQTAPCR